MERSKVFGALEKTAGWVGSATCGLLVALTATLWLGNAISASYSHLKGEEVSSFGTRLTIGLVIGSLPLVVTGVVFCVTEGPNTFRIRRAISKAAWMSWPFLLGFVVFSV